MPPCPASRPVTRHRWIEIRMNQQARLDAENLVDQSLVWDSHVCIGSKVGSHWVDDLQRAHAAGFSFVSVNVGDGELPLENVIRLLADFRHWVAQHNENFALVSTTADIRAAQESGKTGIAFDLEGVHSLEGQINLVPLLYDLGVRWILLAFNRQNWAAGGCHDIEDTGLTAEGLRLIEEMDRVGMVKCCSHTSYKAAFEVLEKTRVPLIFSHSNARAVHDHPRNIPDDLVRACAEVEGVVGVNGLNIFLGEGDDLVELLVRHIDHLVQLVGPAHVGLGLDYVLDTEDLTAAIESHKNTWPPGYGYGRDIRYVQPEHLVEIVGKLLGKGYGSDDIQAILGGNFMRVAEAVWRP